MLLSSNLGKVFFQKWSVIASTMAHLRKDFFNDFFIPKYNEYLYDNYISPLKKYFNDKYYAYNTIQSAKVNILNTFLEINKM